MADTTDPIEDKENTAPQIFSSPMKSIASQPEIDPAIPEQPTSPVPVAKPPVYKDSAKALADLSEETNRLLRETDVQVPKRESQFTMDDFLT